MDFFEKLFSTEKILYPAGFAFVFGLVFMLLSFILKSPYNDWALYIFMALGSLIGNYVKILVMEKEQEKLSEVLRKKKKEKRVNND